MASSVTQTNSQFSNGIQKVSLAWVSHTDGSVSNTFTLPDCELLQVGYKPDGGGTQPSDLYDFTAADPDGADALGGTGANLSNATATKVTPVSNNIRKILAAGTYTLTGANAGSGKGGTIDLLIRPLV